MKKYRVILVIAMINLLLYQKAITSNLHEYIWANYQQFSGNMNSAGKWYQQLFSAQTPSMYCYKGYIHYLDKIGKAKEVISLTSTINDTFKQDPDLQLILINALKKNNQPDIAAKQLIHVYNTFPLHTHIVFEIATMYMNKKELTNALEVIDKLLNNVSSQPNFFVFHFMKAQMYVQLNQLPKALESIKKSLEIHTNFDQGWLMRATIEEALGQLNSAIAGYSHFLKITKEPNQQVAHHLMQLSFKQKMLETNATHAQLNQSWLEKATVLYQQKNYPAALNAIETYLTHEHNNIQARLMKIQILSDMQQFNRAITQLQAWIYENQAQELWFETLHILAQKGAELSHIIKTFEAIHTKYPQNQWGLLYLTDLYLRTHNHKKAIILLEKSMHHIQDKNLLTKVLFQLGLLYFEKQDYRKMETVLEKGHQLGTDFLPLMNLLAHHYATKGKNVAKAEQLLATILKQEKTDPHLLDTHALILYKKKQYNEALMLLQQLHNDLPHDATITIHLAQTYNKLNKNMQAHSTLLKAQTMAKSTYEKNKIAQLMQKWTNPLTHDKQTK